MNDMYDENRVKNRNEQYQHDRSFYDFFFYKKPQILVLVITTLEEWQQEPGDRLAEEDRALGFPDGFADMNPETRKNLKINFVLGNLRMFLETVMGITSPMHDGMETSLGIWLQHYGGLRGLVKEELPNISSVLALIAFASAVFERNAIKTNLSRGKVSDGCCKVLARLLFQNDIFFGMKDERVQFIRRTLNRLPSLQSYLIDILERHHWWATFDCVRNYPSLDRISNRQPMNEDRFYWLSNLCRQIVDAATVNRTHFVIENHELVNGKKVIIQHKIDSYDEACCNSLKYMQNQRLNSYRRTSTALPIPKHLWNPNLVLGPPPSIPMARVLPQKLQSSDIASSLRKLMQRRDDRLMEKSRAEAHQYLEIEINPLSEFPAQSSYVCKTLASAATPMDNLFSSDEEESSDKVDYASFLKDELSLGKSMPFTSTPRKRSRSPDRSAPKRPRLQSFSSASSGFEDNFTHAVVQHENNNSTECFNSVQEFPYSIGAFPTMHVGAQFTNQISPCNGYGAAAYNQLQQHFTTMQAQCQVLQRMKHGQSQVNWNQSTGESGNYSLPGNHYYQPASESAYFGSWNQSFPVADNSVMLGRSNESFYPPPTGSINNELFSSYAPDELTAPYNIHEEATPYFNEAPRDVIGFPMMIPSPISSIASDSEPRLVIASDTETDNI